MKSHLQLRAEEAAARFNRSARRPIVIEFAGVPKAGKTSTIGSVNTFLKRCGFRVRVVVERASVCPIRDKKHSNFNVWTACTTLAQILENTQDPPQADDPQILILDRGILDSVCWLTMMDRLNRIRAEDRQVIEEFLLLPEWRKKLTGVIIMTVSADEAMRREQGLLRVEGAGSIMNPAVLEQMAAITKECVRRFQKQFRFLEIDTSPGRSRGKEEKTAELAADQILNWIEEHLQEDILCVPESELAGFLGNDTVVTGFEAAQVYAGFVGSGRFLPRDQAETDATLVQAIPVVVVRNQSGQVLRLRRRERDAENPLNEKLVIWAGGHVRKEDATNGDPIVQCAVRELKEELRLSIEGTDLQFLGAVYVRGADRTRRHLAIVFEWRAKSDDVAVTLSSAEFFERRGTSLSGTFVALADLASEVNDGRMTEVWSMEISRKLLKVPSASELF